MCIFCLVCRFTQHSFNKVSVWAYHDTSYVFEEHNRCGSQKTARNKAIQQDSSDTLCRHSCNLM